MKWGDDASGFHRSWSYERHAGPRFAKDDRDADTLRFAHDLQVPPTSNQAERDLRPAKVQQNISGRLTSEERTQDRYTIRGYLSPGSPGALLLKNNL